MLFCMGPTSSEHILMVLLRALDWYSPSLLGFLWTPAPKLLSLQREIHTSVYKKAPRYEVSHISEGEDQAPQIWH